MSDATICLYVPDLGIACVEIGVWYARPGDHVYQGDRLVEIIVEGATVDVTAPATGTLVECLAHPRDRLAPGTVLGAVAPDPE